MLTKTGQSALLDILLRSVPGLQDAINNKSKNAIHPAAADNLYRLWKDEKHKIKEDLYVRPATLAKTDIEKMVENGLVEKNSHTLKITQKGKDALKIIILGSSDSIFEKEKEPDFSKCVAGIDSNKARSMQKTASDQWWSRFEK